MKIISLILLGLFMMFSTAFAEHDDNFDYQIIQINPDFESEMILLKATASLIELQIKVGGIESLVKKIQSSRPGLHSYSEFAFLAIFENSCILIFHGYNAKFAEPNFCKTPDTSGVPDEIKKINEDGVSYAKFVMRHIRKHTMPNGTVIGALIEYHMEGYIVKYGKYAIILNTHRNIGMGLPKGLKSIQKRNQIFAGKRRFA